MATAPGLALALLARMLATWQLPPAQDTTQRAGVRPALALLARTLARTHSKAGLRGWAVRAALRLTQQANDRAASAQDAGVRAERALDAVVRTGESDV